MKRSRKCPATQLSLEYLRGLGMRVDIVERNIPSKPFPIKHDLFGLFDLLALDALRGRIFFVQTTSATNRSSRRVKMEAAGDVLADIEMLRMGALLITWKKTGHGTAHSWECVVERATAEYGPDQQYHVTMQPSSMPTMVEVRKRVRDLGKIGFDPAGSSLNYRRNQYGKKLPHRNKRESSSSGAAVDPLPVAGSVD